MQPSDPDRGPRASGFPAGVTVKIEYHGQDAVVVVAGELDVLTAPKLDEQISIALETEPPLLVIDLTDVTFLGSAGMTSLVTAHRMAGTATTVRIVASGRTTARAMQIVGLDQQLPIYATLGDAVSADR
ncbi:MAG TPA: STAS domain-containing protein [Amycolatopsis sp.]|nr:STAS domain-containing protein [Amycolatopsis sp.]